MRPLLGLDLETLDGRGDVADFVLAAPGSTIAKLPSASSFMARVSATIGRAIVMTENTQAPINSSATERPIAREFRSVADISRDIAAFSSSTICLAD